MDKRSRPAAPGTLYVVASPIGNLEDMTLRALSVLKAVNLVAAEDTRKTGRLLRHFGITAALVSYHEHNETVRTPDLVRRLQQGASIAVLTNAGTPGISDPGYRIVAAAAAAGLRIVPVPGAVAAAAAISVSGLPTDAFVFEGFLAKKAGKRTRQIKALASETRTIVLYESPQRITALIAELLLILGDRRAVLAREMTKRYEEFIRGRLSDIRENLNHRTDLKGECTLLIAGRAAEGPSSWEGAREDIRQGLSSPSKGLAELVKEVAAAHGLPRNAVYAETVKMKAELNEDGNDRLPNDGDPINGT
jgi:16S rRNA (cytidine1402-2'-O)-methyltransferase